MIIKNKYEKLHIPIVVPCIIFFRMSKIGK
jgi:hypothetical protein